MGLKNSRTLDRVREGRSELLQRREADVSRISRPGVGRG